MNELRGQIYSTASGAMAWQNWSTACDLQAPTSGEHLVLLKNSQGELQGAVRDPLGMMPGYFAASALNEMMIETSLPKLLGQVADKSIDWDTIYALWADNYESTRRSPFKAISKVPAGHLLFKSDSQWQSRSFFKNLQASSASLRETFDQVLQERVQATKPFSLFLSGGFDSALIFRLLEKQNINFHAVSLNFTSGAESEQKALETLSRTSKQPVDIIDGHQLDRSHFEWKSEDRFFYSPTLSLFKPLLERARQKGSRSVWTGLGADEVFVRDQALLKQLLLSGEVQLFLQSWKQKQNHGLSFPQLIFALLREFMPSGVRLALSKKLKLKSDLSLPEVHQLAHLRRAHRFENQRRFKNSLDAEMIDRVFESGMIAFCCEQEQALAENYQLQFCYPFLDLRLIACVLEQPARFFTGHGLDKFGLRQTFADLLPAEISFCESAQAYDQWQQPFLRQLSDLVRNSQNLGALKDLATPYNFSNLESKNALLKQLYALHIQTW
jgi:asparagine synthetase B (glutamine-hydrolysing)